MATRIPVLGPPGVGDTYGQWVSEVAAALDGSGDPNATVANIAASIHPAPNSAFPWGLASEIYRAQFDPRSVTLEAEYYGEMDPERFYKVKPLLCLWRLFDRSVLGPNVHLGLRFREMLAQRVFARCGERPRIFEDVTFSFGYNVSIGDDVTVHRNVFIDDRGEVVIGRGVSLSDFANVYSHSHDPLDSSKVTIHSTVIEDGARITYHATVLAGTRVHRDSIVGCHGVVTRDIGERHIAVGVPAKSIRVKGREIAAPPKGT